LKLKLKIALVTLFVFSSTMQLYAQCAMCRAVLESEEGSTKKAEAVNDGIVYLMAIPYVLVGVVGYFIYKSMRKKV
jgi:hypothetical protein